MLPGAESLAEGPAAKSRKSNREDAFVLSIEIYILARETRSRENGWSFTQPDHQSSREAVPATTAQGGARAPNDQKEAPPRLEPNGVLL